MKQESLFPGTNVSLVWRVFSSFGFLSRMNFFSRCGVYPGVEVFFLRTNHHDFLWRSSFLVSRLCTYFVRVSSGKKKAQSGSDWGSGYRQPRFTSILLQFNLKAFSVALTPKGHKSRSWPTCSCLVCFVTGSELSFVKLQCSVAFFWSTRDGFSKINEG